MPSVSSSVVFAFIVSLSVLPTILADARCYYPPLEEKLVYQPLDTPCNPNAQESNCCAPDDICLSNGLCWRANINRLHRGSCTDPTFASPSCTRFCTAPGTHDHGFADVLECPNFDGRFYCDLGNSSTCETEHTFYLPDGYFADYRNVTSGPGPAIVTVTEPADATCTDHGKGGNGNGAGNGAGNGGGKGTKDIPGSATASIGSIGTTILQSFAPTSATPSSIVQAFNGTSGAEGPQAMGLGKGAGLLLAGAMFLF